MSDKRMLRRQKSQTTPTINSEYTNVSFSSRKI